MLAPLLEVASDLSADLVPDERYRRLLSAARRVVPCDAVTLLELVGTPLLAAGKFVVPIAGYFIFQLTLGIAMVHAKEGWFVVGLGRNGVEYSVLLITCLVVLILGEREARAARHA